MTVKMSVRKQSFAYFEAAIGDCMSNSQNNIILGKRTFVQLLNKITTIQIQHHTIS